MLITTGYSQHTHLGTSSRPCSARRSHPQHPRQHQQRCPECCDGVTVVSNLATHDTSVKITLSSDLNLTDVSNMATRDTSVKITLSSALNLTDVSKVTHLSKLH